ncbi:MAG: hypothetical protein ETSY1_09165 [Candidatus Entotheonella factor]|uniref:Signal peptidase I n=1 Tax=Entotheonella factor TaxID=1429438 RepID=W4LSI3_ENTF1|nr:MAG: hypothetical protein ETSY1_09165 [Candidatus Entotheonella factor]
MSSRRQWYGLWAGSLALAGMALLLACRDLRWNYSHSMPPGLWRFVDPRFDPARGRGQVVLFCPPRTAVFEEAKARGYIPFGRCAGGLAPLLKPVVALPGDRVEIGAEVWVNGVVVAGSDRLVRDRQGRAMPVPRGGVVPPGYVWVVSIEHARSFDSRYFGQVSIARIEGVLEPFWTRSEK